MRDLQLLLLPVCGCILGLLADKWRGRSFLAWFVIGALLGLFSPFVSLVGVFILAFVPDKRPALPEAATPSAPDEWQLVPKEEGVAGRE